MALKHEWFLLYGYINECGTVSGKRLEVILAQ